MEYYDNSICHDCHRDSFCEAPCSAFLDDLDRFNKEQNIVDETEISRGNECGNNCLTDFFEYDIENPEYLEFIQGKITAEEFLDINSMKRLMETKNEEYCEQHNLCTECHTPLEKHNIYEEVWGSKLLVGVEYTCPNGCN